MRARFRPHREVRVEVIRDYDFMRDLAAIRATDGVMFAMTTVTNEFLFQVGDDYISYMVKRVLRQLDEQWRRVIQARAPRMRAAYDRKRRARRARCRR